MSEPIYMPQFGRVREGEYHNPRGPHSLLVSIRDEVSCCNNKQNFEYSEKTSHRFCMHDPDNCYVSEYPELRFDKYGLLAADIKTYIPYLGDF